ncbi:MAG TPA: YbjQ family protein [Acidimicrobiales bacterium]|nr:YbjQ family protein [Acidimicrobiales bacterium]
MLIVTTNDLPGHRVTKVIGEVNGLTVRTRNVGAQIGASFKALGGGELRGLTKQMEEARHEALERLSEAASALGANAVLAMRYDSNELGGTFQEILAYGTAVVVENAA